MRVTQGMMSNQFMANLNANNKRLSIYQEQMASGKKLNRPSDDPVAVGYAMRYDAQINRNDQYKRNVDDGTSNLEFIDSTLNQVNSIYHRARELAIQGANGTNSTTSRTAIAGEIHQLRQQLINIGNTKFNDRYLFNGQLTDVQPYDPNNANYNSTDNGVINYMMSEGATIQVNVIGNDVFGQPATVGNEANSDNAFTVLDQLEQALRAGNQNGIEQSMGNLNSRMAKTQDVWSDVGARMNRVELLHERLADLDTNIQGLLSKTVDVDVAEAVMNMKMAENVQRASLETGAKIIQPSLVDFMR